MARNAAGVAPDASTASGFRAIQAVRLAPSLSKASSFRASRSNHYLVLENGVSISPSHSHYVKRCRDLHCASTLLVLQHQHSISFGRADKGSDDDTVRGRSERPCRHEQHLMSEVHCGFFYAAVLIAADKRIPDCMATASSLELPRGIDAKRGCCSPSLLSSAWSVRVGRASGRRIVPTQRTRAGTDR